MGLYDQLDTFAIGIVGRPEKRKEVINCLNTLDIKYTVCAEADTGWEAVTQQPMHDFAQTNDGLILYAHTKGAANNHEVNTRWRRSMTYWCVIRWADCVEKLKECDTVGNHWIYPTINMPEHKFGNPMYAGTFYWCRAELMRTWMRVPLTHRFESEGWIGYKYVQKPWRLWDWTPYFPNSNHFADGWVNDANFKGVETGVFVQPIVLHDKQVPND